MAQTKTIAPFTTVPEDVEAELSRLLQLPVDPAIGEWLYELTRASGHLSTAESMRWRLLCLLWLACEYNPDQAWPYLMWLNQNETVISDHLSEILIEVLDDFNIHLRLARWQADVQDERLITFLSGFRNLPLPYKMGDAFAGLLDGPQTPELEPWLANFCRHTVDQVSPYIRPWHLFAAVWYATCFNQQEGLAYLKAFSANQITLSDEAMHTLNNMAEQLTCTPIIAGWIAACPNSEVKILLQEFGHPDLAVVTETIFKAEPDYAHLKRAAAQAPQDADRFKRNLELLKHAGVTPSSRILDLACGPLAWQTILLHSAGYTVAGVGLPIPPMGLSPAGFMNKLRRSLYIKAWQTAAAPYFDRLAQESGLKLTSKKLALSLADVTRLEYDDNSFEAVICCNHLQHAPTVSALLAEAARVLKPGGLFLADIVPFPAFGGGFNPLSQSPWEHLQQPGQSAGVILNQWSEAQYRTALERHFTIDSWLTNQDDEATAHLTPEIQANLPQFSAEELTRQRVIVLARKL